MTFDARLVPSMETAAMLRRTEMLGGFGTVLNKGDPERGAILLLLLERGVPRCFLERLLRPDGRYVWQAGGPSTIDSNTASQYVARRQRSDPDCWVLELDIPSAERFIAEMNSLA